MLEVRKECLTGIAVRRNVESYLGMVVWVHCRPAGASLAGRTVCLLTVEASNH